MKKLYIPIAFFIFGIGVSYFSFNHNIVSKKGLLNEEIESLFDQNLSGEEINGRIFQLLFAYFAIDLRDIEERVSTKIKDSIKVPEPKVIEKVVEKVIYVERKEPLPEVKKEVEAIKKVIPITFRNLESFNFSSFLKNSSPILVKDKSFDRINGTHKYIGHNPQGPNFEVNIENIFKLQDNSYIGTSKIDYLELGKIEDSIKVDGMPLNFLKNTNYPKWIAARISKDRYILLNTSEKFYRNNIRGALYLRKGSKFNIDGILRLKSSD